MNDLYEAFCLVDPVFYDAPGAAVADDGLLARLDRVLPTGWTLTAGEVWTSVRPDDVELPAQGWKVHVSACLDNARRVLTKVWDHCIAERLHFKFLDTPATFIAQNAKYAERSGSGKFVTIYPVDEAALERTLRVLGGELRGEHGPYILSDLRWEDGPLFVRYGGFLLEQCRTAQGALVPAIRDPHGELVPDERAPALRIPPWVQLPAVLDAAWAAHEAEPDEPFPYTITGALHFSNGGGVYTATDAAGAAVVIKEARPFAGLDAEGVDAVTRLEQEHRNLRRLAGLDCVPTVVDLLAHWEHRFLVEEHVDGTTLNEEMVQRHPLIHPHPSDDDIAAYTAWALAVLDRLDAAVAAVHGRGIVLGDLHPRNVMVRPDGSVCLIDLEIAHDVDAPWTRAMGAPGYAAPPGCSGFAVDRHALGAIRLSLFLPYTELLAWDPDKADELIEAVEQRFPVPATWAASVRGDLAATPAPVGDAGVRRRWRERCWPRHGLPRWEAVRDEIAGGIRASATPGRVDRLFPGDPAQFELGGLGLAYGAAGVLWALHETGATIDEAHLDWLADAAIAAADDGEAVRPGLYDGLAGIGYALDCCGRQAAADAVFARLLDAAPDGDDHSLFSGTAGIGLVRLHLARRSGRRRHLDAARAFVAAGRRALDVGSELHPRAGLLHGWSGLALLAIRLYETDFSTSWLDVAERALGADLARCVLAADGTMQFDEGWRLLPYLGVGSAGVGIVLDQLLAHRPGSPLAAHRTALHTAAVTETVIQCGLFNGRAGLILALDGSRPEHADAVRAHVARLAWHAVPYRGHIGFVGDQLARLSMDLGTGAAGVLLAIGAAMSERPITLPFLRPAPAVPGALAPARAVPSSVHCTHERR